MKVKQYDELGGGNNQVEWYNLTKGSHQLVLLSAISASTVGKENFNFGKELLVYPEINQWIEGGLQFNDNPENKYSYLNLPLLDEESHEDESLPYFDIIERLDIADLKVQNKYIVWVLDANKPLEDQEPMICQLKKTIVDSLAEYEVMMGDLRGRIIQISKSGKGRDTKYTTAVMPSDPVDVSDIELEDLTGFVKRVTLREQINYVNQVSESFCKWRGLSSYPLAEFVNNDTNEEASVEPEADDIKI